MSTTTICADNDCDVFDYDEVPECEMRQVADEVKGAQSSCRWRWGVYSLGPSSIGVSPPLKDTEQIEVEWRGLKRNYNDDDLIPDEAELEQAVVNYVMAQVSKLYDHDLEAAAASDQAWKDTIGEMAHDCRENGGPQVAMEEDDIGARFAFTFVADGGLAGAAQTQVASLIEWINPDALLFGGNNNYTAGSSSTIGTNWAAYKKFIDRNAVFPALGPVDLDTESGKPQLSLFDNPGNGRYYIFRRGEVEFFCINSGVDSSAALVESDGNTATSTQGQWLQAALAASRATWKVVYFHDAPYSNASLTSPGATDLRWPFGAWGADVVLSGGGNYERLSAGGLPYFVVGTGGSALDSFVGSPTAESLKRNSNDFGALKVVADRKRMVFKFYTAERDLDDVFVLEK